MSRLEILSLSFVAAYAKLFKIHWCLSRLSSNVALSSHNKLTPAVKCQSLYSSPPSMYFAPEDVPCKPVICKTLSFSCFSIGVKSSSDVDQIRSRNLVL